MPITTTCSLTKSTYFNKQFTARVGAKTDVVDSRKNCQIYLKLEDDPGFSFSVYQADYSGWADLDDGVTGVVKANYYFSSYTDQVRQFLPSTSWFYTSQC